MGRYKPNTGTHIVDIINRTTCEKHKAEKGEPCYHIRYNEKRNAYGPAICGSRVIKAGFNGQIHPSSLGRKATQPSL